MNLAFLSAWQGPYILVKIHESLERLLVSLTKIENSFEKASSPENNDPFQIITVPLEAPTDGRN
jgi:hypothetical protein